MIELAGEGLLWVAGAVTLVGAFGMLRFPDFYTRCHAATMVSIGGFSLALAGIALQDLFGVHFTKILLVFFLNIITNPTATHALASSAFRLGIKPVGAVRDDLSARGVKA
jgi:multicomponent Na+:H+ antiporter subunit G